MPHTFEICFTDMWNTSKNISKMIYLLLYQYFTTLMKTLLWLDLSMFQGVFSSRILCLTSFLTSFWKWLPWPFLWFLSCIFPQPFLLVYYSQMFYRLWLSKEVWTICLAPLFGLNVHLSHFSKYYGILNTVAYL